MGMLLHLIGDELRLISTVCWLHG